jgi:hypothetical protein
MGVYHCPRCHRTSDPMPSPKDGAALHDDLQHDGQLTAIAEDDQ